MHRCLTRIGHLVLLAIFAVLFSVHPASVFAGDDQMPKKHLTPDELLRKRIAEAMSGRRDITTPHSQILVGPDLTDAEKVMHVLDRMSFGAKPGQVEEILKNGGYKAWIKEQMDPDRVDDATADRVIAERFKWTKMS